MIGSLPTAYLIVLVKHNKDIRKEGSGNVGTLNAFTVSKSKLSGIMVLLIDLIKGALPIILMLIIFKFSYSLIIAGSVALIAGHNYPVWLKFKGGRGLATSAGIFLVLNYWILLGWCAAWLICFAFKRKVLIANTFATLFIPVTVYLVVKFDWMKVNLPFVNDINCFVVGSVLITLVILTRNLEVFKNILINKKES